MTGDEFTRLKRDFSFLLQFDLPSDTLGYRRKNVGAATVDPEFGKVKVITSTTTAIRYTQALQSALKVIEPTGVDFFAADLMTVYLATFDMEAAVIYPPRREHDFLVLNGKVYSIMSVMPFPQLYKTSVAVRFICKEAPPQEQDNP